MLETGQRPEGFALQDHDGEEVRWEDLAGRPVVVFAYPKADTPGCTREACAFRDLSDAFAERGVQVLGVSADPVDRQARFARKYDLTMPLLSDPDHEVLEAWGAWGEKRMYGRTYEGIIRSTFLFDAEGVLRRAWRKVRVKGHAEAVLEAVDELLG